MIATLSTAAVLLPFTPDAVRYANAATAVLALFVLVVATVVEFDRISKAWRRVLYAAAAQQAVIAYGSVEAAQGGTGGDEFRVYAAFVSVLALTIAALGVILAHRHDSRVR